MAENSANECEKNSKEEEKKEEEEAIGRTATDEWTTVHKVHVRRPRRNNRPPYRHQHQHRQQQPSQQRARQTTHDHRYRTEADQALITHEGIRAALTICLREVQASDYWRTVQHVLRNKVIITTQQHDEESSVVEEEEKDCYLSPTSASSLSSPHNNNNSSSNTSMIRIQSIVCYGIGNFGTKRPSAPLWQLALAITIRDFIGELYNNDNKNDNDDDKNKKSQIEEDDHDHVDDRSMVLPSDKATLNTITSGEDNNNNGNNAQQKQHNQSHLFPTMYYFEPLITAKESYVLEQLGIQIIAENERGKRSVMVGDDSNDDNNNNGSSSTLFYMPHCPMTLYANVLYTNWDHLDENTVFIFGNSLSNYVDNSKQHNYQQQSMEILQTLQPYWNEEILTISKNDISESSAYFEQAFNDSSLTSFWTSRSDQNNNNNNNNNNNATHWPLKRPQQQQQCDVEPCNNEVI